MDRRLFLLALNAIVGKMATKIEIDAIEVHLLPLEDERLRLSTKIYQSCGELSQNIREIMSSSGTFRWHHKGAFLKCESSCGSIMLIHEIPFTKSYRALKGFLENFCQTAKEWKVFFSGVEEDEMVFISQ